MRTGIKKKIRVIINPKSGLLWSFDTLRKAIDKYWDLPENEIFYQFTKSIDDGITKARRAVDERVDVLLVAGGDGTVNTIGRQLIGSKTAIGIIPAGSGNGFARHFEIPLGPEKAVKALAEAKVKRIDVGMVNKAPFLVTCSMAWDASIVRSFEKSLFRGILPYVFAGVNEFIRYKPQEIRFELDSGEEMVIPDPVVFTIANLTQFGAGAKIAPQAKADDGFLELVIARNKDIPTLVSQIHRLFDGTVHKLPQLTTRRFKQLKVHRQHSDNIQIDGEVVEEGREIVVEVLPSCLNILVP